MKAIYKEWLPPAVVEMARTLRDKLWATDAISFTGSYAAWAEALRDCTGYDSDLVLQKTRAALLQVKRGEVAYERDSVLFDKVQHSFPLLSGLLRAAASGGHLCVIDFGGSLGSSYFQCRSFLKPVRQLRWLIVEQPAHVACGRKDFEDEELRFCYTVEECLAQGRPNVLLLSSVLQYLPDPYQVLHELLGCGFPHVILDRMPFLESGGERLTVQHVPSSIYEASYPAWFLSEKKLTAAITNAGYTLVADFPALDKCSPVDEKANSKGFIYEKNGIQ